MSRPQFHRIDLFILRHAWLSLRDKHMLLAGSTRKLQIFFFFFFCIGSFFFFFFFFLCWEVFFFFFFFLFKKKNPRDIVSFPVVS
jgi:hypothetical protein